MSVKELIDQIGGRERLEFIAENAISMERIIMARALLAVLDAQEKPVGTVSIVQDLYSIPRRNIATVNLRPDLVLSEMRDGDNLYTVPPSASAPDGLAAAVNHLLDSDGSRGTFSAIRRGNALAEVERLLAAAPAPENKK